MLYQRSHETKSRHQAARCSSNLAIRSRIRSTVRYRYQLIVTGTESAMDFLRYLLTGYNDPGHASQRVQRLLRSFAHDMVYAVTGGHTKPPNNIVLAFTVKSMTGNGELINVLNRFADGRDRHSLVTSKTVSD